MSVVRCQQIREADISAVVDLFARGFPKRKHDYWLRAFDQLRRREPPPGLPHYGYFLESDGVPVGVLLLIWSTARAGGTISTRCNLSSWYVEPSFRVYSTMLVSHALQHKEITYLNISPNRNTWPIIEVQGFSRYSEGLFMRVTLNGLFASRDVKVFEAYQRPEADFDLCDQEVLRHHATFGCISLWATTSERAYPFVFRRRLLKGVIPFVELLYCREVAEFVRFAGPLGRFLALRGILFVLVDAKGPIPGLVGVFFRDRSPRYFKGPQRPRLGDLAYTELAIFGG